MKMDAERWIEELVEGHPAPHVARADTGVFTGNAVSARTVANCESKFPDDIAEGRFMVGKRVMYPSRSYATWLARKFFKTAG